MIDSGFDWAPIWLTLKLASLTSLILCVLGIPLAGWLTHTTARYRSVIETLVALPLVLPPSVLGFYLLLAFAPTGIIDYPLWTWFELSLVFSFAGLVVGSVLFSLPFMVQPLVAALLNLPPQWREASYTLGHSPFSTFWRIELPCVWPALLSGLVMSFAHTVGEFGLVMMLGGNVPEISRVASIAIYHEVEMLNYPAAHRYAALLCGFSFIVLLAVHWMRRRGLRR